MPQVLIRPGLLDRLKEVRGLTDQAMADIGHVSLSTYRRYRDRETQPSGEFIARTCLANQYANVHIAIHYDSTDSDKGAFFMSVPEVGTYRRMEPVASHWQEHNALGKAVIGGIRQAGGKIFGAGNMNMDLTQTSYSTIPSIDLEIGDRASDHSPAVQGKLMDGVVLGLKQYFGL